jgi:hypothetical protein
MSAHWALDLAGKASAARPGADRDRPRPDNAVHKPVLIYCAPQYQIAFRGGSRIREEDVAEPIVRLFA